MNPNIPVAAIMTQSPITVNPQDNLIKIQSIFKQYDFHHIPVLAKDRSVVGIVSKADMLIFMKRLTQETTGKRFTAFSEAATLIKNIMTPNPLVLEPSDTVGLAADIFMTNTFHALPIVEDNQLVGIITSHDLLQYAFKGVLTRNEEEYFEDLAREQVCIDPSSKKR